MYPTVPSIEVVNLLCAVVVFWSGVKAVAAYGVKVPVPAVAMLVWAESAVLAFAVGAIDLTLVVHRVVTHLPLLALSLCWFGIAAVISFKGKMVRLMLKGE